MREPVTNIMDLRELARRRVPRAFFEYADRGSYDEVTLGNNRKAFEAIRLRQRVMIDVDERNLSTTLLGQARVVDEQNTRRWTHRGEMAHPCFIERGCLPLRVGEQMLEPLGIGIRDGGGDCVAILYDISEQWRNSASLLRLAHRSDFAPDQRTRN